MPGTVKNFLNKPAHQLTIADTFLMQVGSSLIAITVPAVIGTLGAIFAKRRNSQELHGL